MRAGLAQLGFRSMDELIGRADLLRQRDLSLAKTAGLDLSFLTTYAGGQLALAGWLRPWDSRLFVDLDCSRYFVSTRQP